MEEALEQIIAGLSAKETKARLEAIQAAEAYVEAEPLDGENAPQLVEVLGPALTDNNLKVAQGALSLLIGLMEALGEELAPHVGRLWKPLIEKLGDAKSHIKERAVDLAVLLATLVLPPQQALDGIAPAWKHKNWRAQESALLWFGRLLAAQEEGSPGVSLKAMLPQVVELLEHRELSVREAAMLCVEQMARHWGASLPNELGRMNVRPNILKPLLARLGAATPAEPSADGEAPLRGQTSTSSTGSRGSTQRSASPSVNRPKCASGSPKGGGGGGGSRGGWGSAEDAGAPTDEEVVPLTVYSERELAKEMEGVREQMGNASEWTVRLGALKRLQALTLGGCVEFDTFAGLLKTLREPLSAQCAELRSSLVKEATHALELLVSQMGESFEPFAEVYVPIILKGTVVTIQARPCLVEHADPGPTPGPGIIRAGPPPPRLSVSSGPPPAASTRWRPAASTWARRVLPAGDLAVVARVHSLDHSAVDAR